MYLDYNGGLLKNDFCFEPNIALQFWMFDTCTSLWFADSNVYKFSSMVYGVIALNGPKVEIDSKEEIFENISLNI